MYYFVKKLKQPNNHYMKLPPNIHLVSNQKGMNIYCNGIYRFNEGTEESKLLDGKPWYFTVSVSYNFHSTAVYLCNAEGQYLFNGTNEINDKLKAHFEDSELWKDGRICLMSDVEECLWKMDHQNSKFSHFISKGTYEQKRLIEIKNALENPELTKEQVLDMFNEQYERELAQYLEFMNL